jgi:hypothetical protein
VLSVGALPDHGLTDLPLFYRDSSGTMSWDEFQRRKAELKAGIHRDRTACRDTDLKESSKSIEVQCVLLSTFTFPHSKSPLFVTSSTACMRARVPCCHLRLTLPSGRGCAVLCPPIFPVGVHWPK